MLPRVLEPEVMSSEQEALEYDQMDHSTVNQLFVDDLLTVVRASLPENADLSSRRIVDIGTGTIQIPIRLLRTCSECGPIAACDLSDSMLKLGMKNLRQAGLEHLILPIFCDARSLPFADDSVDIIISNSIVHHIPEPLEVFRELSRCIRPGGVVFIRDLLRPESESQLKQLVRLHAGSETSHARQMFSDSLHAALTLSELRKILVTVGLNPDSALQTSDRHWTVSCTA